MKWPEAPAELQQPAGDLKPLPADKKTLADLVSNANENYGAYYQLKERYEAWQHWYQEHKKIYESVK
jgi:hypothetical protein